MLVDASSPSLSAAALPGQRSAPAADAAVRLAATTVACNPIRDGADPFIASADGAFHLVHRELDEDGKEALYLSSAPTMALLGAAVPLLLVRAAKVGAGEAEELWAPELHEIDGRWYLYFAADDRPGNTHHRMYVSESVSGDIRGPYLPPRRLVLPQEKWAIDATVLDLGPHERYMVWSGWAGDVNDQQNLYIARMSDPFTVSSDRVLISAPTHDWEQRTGGRDGLPTVNEGPAVLVAHGRIFLTYSASGSWTPDYCLGLLTAELGSDLLDPASWSKTTRPVFTSVEGAWGPGHNSFVTAPDGITWLVYHANDVHGSGWEGRSMRAQPLGWNADGTPDFGAPAVAQRRESAFAA